MSRVDTWQHQRGGRAVNINSNLLRGARHDFRDELQRQGTPHAELHCPAVRAFEGAAKFLLHCRKAQKNGAEQKNKDHDQVAERLEERAFVTRGALLARAVTVLSEVTFNTSTALVAFVVQSAEAISADAQILRGACQPAVEAWAALGARRWASPNSRRGTDVIRNRLQPEAGLRPCDLTAGAPRVVWALLTCALLNRRDQSGMEVVILARSIGALTTSSRGTCMCPPHPTHTCRSGGRGKNLRSQCTARRSRSRR